MSRLDSFIARMQAQKTLLDAAAAELKSAGETLPGPAFELGLGNGRTYDHMREVFAGRRVIAFDRHLMANPKSTPPPEDLILGDIEETAPAFARTHGAIGAVLHADLGNGVAADDLKLQKWLPVVATALLRSGAIILTSTRLDHPALGEQPLPENIQVGRYYIYRRA